MAGGHRDVLARATVVLGQTVALVLCRMAATAARGEAASGLA